MLVNVLITTALVSFVAWMAVSHLLSQRRDEKQKEMTTLEKFRQTFDKPPQWHNVGDACMWHTVTFDRNSVGDLSVLIKPGYMHSTSDANGFGMVLGKALGNGGQVAQMNNGFIKFSSRRVTRR